MGNPNFVRNIYRNDDKRMTIYYDRKPSTSADRDRRICLKLASSGQIIRFSPKEALELIESMARVLKKQQR